MNKKIYYFTAPWCGPCTTLGPIMDSLSNQIPFKKVNVDNDNTTPQQFNIRNVPTLVLVENSQEVGRLTGVRTKQEILNFYNQ